jgi:hypothetical protein
MNAIEKKRPSSHHRSPRLILQHKTPIWRHNLKNDQGIIRSIEFPGFLSLRRPANGGAEIE